MKETPSASFQPGGPSDVAMLDRIRQEKATTLHLQPLGQEDVTTSITTASVAPTLPMDIGLRVPSTPLKETLLHQYPVHHPVSWTLTQKTLTPSEGFLKRTEATKGICMMQKDSMEAKEYITI